MTTMPSFRISRLLLVAGALALAGRIGAETVLRGPVMGYVLDPQAQAIRPINGIPGAAHLGPPLSLPLSVERAVFSSRGDFALVVAADGGVYVVRELSAPQPDVTPISGAILHPNLLTLSVSNTAAVLYSAESRQTQVIRNLPDAGESGPAIPLDGTRGVVTALAVDHAGQQLLIAASDGGQGALYRTPASGGEFRLVSVFADPVALVMAGDDRDVLVADSGANRIYRVRDYAGEAALLPLAGPPEGVRNLRGIEVSADERQVFFAAGEGLFSLDLETQSLEVHNTFDAPPTRVERLQGRATFLLTEPGDQPLLIFDTADRPQVYFVPAWREN